MTLRVLIVDDDSALRDDFAAALAATPDMQTVGMAADLAEGTRLLCATRPDVLLVDLGLPDGDGVALIREAARTLPDCDVLVVTVFGDERHVQESRPALRSRSRFLQCVDSSERRRPASLVPV